MGRNVSETIQELRDVLLKFQAEANTQIDAAKQKANNEIFKEMQRQVNECESKLKSLAQGLTIKEKPKEDFKTWLQKWT